MQQTHARIGKVTYRHQNCLKETIRKIGRGGTPYIIERTNSCMCWECIQLRQERSAIKKRKKEKQRIKLREQIAREFTLKELQSMFPSDEFIVTKKSKHNASKRREVNVTQPQAKVQARHSLLPRAGHCVILAIACVWVACLVSVI